MTIVIERATTADAERLVKVQIAAFHHDAQIYRGVALGGPPGYDFVAQTLEKIQEDECYTIGFEGQIIGGIVLFAKGKGHYHLDLIFLDPAYHGRGIGTQAMQFIERAYPATLWTLDTPLYAVRNHHFYQKLGYLKVGEHDDDDGTRLIAYEKPIA